MDPVFLLDRTRMVHQCIVHKTAKQANKLKSSSNMTSFIKFCLRATKSTNIFLKKNLSNVVAT